MPYHNKKSKKPSTSKLQKVKGEKKGLKVPKKKNKK